MTTLTDAFVAQFADTFYTLGQQKRSRLEQRVRRKPGSIVGQSFTIDTIGAVEASVGFARGADLVYADPAIGRRIATMQDPKVPVLVDDDDKLKMIIEPTNPLVTAALAGINRFKDKMILAALTGNVTTMTGGAFGTTASSALPAAQKIAVGGTGLTLAKLRAAKALLDDAEQDASEFFQMSGLQMAKQDGYGNLAMPSYVLVCTAQQIDNLLSDSTVTSEDYNSVKALVSGSINTFMGFEFVRVPAAFLAKVSTSRFCVAYSPNAIEYGVGRDASALVERIPQKDGYQILAKASIGAGRAEDAGVVEIACLES